MSVKPFAPRSNLAFIETDAARISHSPTDIWTLIRGKIFSESFTLKAPKVEEKAPGNIRVVCISDTHMRHNRIKPEHVPMGDILIHSGDITLSGKAKAFNNFRNWIKTLPHPNKLVIAGNHDLGLDESKMQKNEKKKTQLIESRKQIVDVEEFTYLQEDAIEVEGYKFYGSPLQPDFHNWAFQEKRGEPIRKYWQTIPDDTEVLITHGKRLFLKS